MSILDSEIVQWRAKFCPVAAAAILRFITAFEAAVDTCENARASRERLKGKPPTKDLLDYFDSLNGDMQKAIDEFRGSIPPLLQFAASHHLKVPTLVAIHGDATLTKSKISGIQNEIKSIVECIDREALAEENKQRAREHIASSSFQKDQQDGKEFMQSLAKFSPAGAALLEGYFVALIDLDASRDGGQAIAGFYRAAQRLTEFADSIHVHAPALHRICADYSLLHDEAVFDQSKAEMKQIIDRIQDGLPNTDAVPQATLAGDAPFQLSECAMKILKMVANSSTRVMIDNLTGASGLPQDPKTIRYYVNEELIVLGLVERKSRRSGIAITAEGRRFIGE